MTDIIIQKMITYYGTDVLRINHALKVYSFANFIAKREELSEKQLQIVDIAAILHDIGIKAAEKKYNSSSGHYQEIEGPPIARELLADLNLDDTVLERICFLIGNHHSYQHIDGIDFQILIEADFLVNSYENQLSNDSIERFRKSYFKTQTGIATLESMYATAVGK
jgi:HD superfamily phosphodiesterase